MINNLRKTDKDIFYFISAENKRQNETINLIASENITPDRVLELLGSDITNKYCG